MKDKMSDKQYYAISLWDYSLPAICSGSSYYYGTMNEITRFMEALSEKEKTGFENTIAAFEQYKQGVEDATHNVAYAQMRLITPVKLIEEGSQSFPACEWTYLNTYGAPYYLKCDGGKCVQLLVKRDKKYYKCIRFYLENLQYSSDYDRDSWRKLDGGFWGHPCMIDVDRFRDSKFVVHSNLFAEEKVFDTIKAAHLDNLNNNTVPDIAAFAKDVFGDG